VQLPVPQDIPDLSELPAKAFIPLAALACALAAAPAAAQDAPAGPTSLSLQLGGGYAVGVWRDVPPRMRAGIGVGTSVSRTAGDGYMESRSEGSFGDDRVADGWTAATFTSGVVVHLFF
jgi:uncharacterized protein YfiM (DUF2279 family)